MRVSESQIFFLSLKKLWLESLKNYLKDIKRTFCREKIFLSLLLKVSVFLLDNKILAVFTNFYNLDNLHLMTVDRKRLCSGFDFIIKYFLKVAKTFCGTGSDKVHKIKFRRY